MEWVALGLEKMPTPDQEAGEWGASDEGHGTSLDVSVSSGLGATSTEDEGGQLWEVGESSGDSEWSTDISDVYRK